MTSYTTLKHPAIGELLLIANTTELTGIWFADIKFTPKIQPDWKHDPAHPLLEKATQQLRDYFDGRLSTFTLPLKYEGTDFQRSVWKQIARIPFGQTITYGELAKRAGNPRAVRAAGTATGRNPFCVVVPCHRVLASNGGLGGFAGGLPRKKRLLAVESKPSKLNHPR